jgi:hypothetical protein
MPCHQYILFFLVMQSGCKGSKGGALVFNANQRGPNWASTRDLQLISTGSPISSDQILWRPDFDALLLDKQYIFFLMIALSELKLNAFTSQLGIPWSECSD